MLGIIIIIFMSCLAIYGASKSNYITLNILTFFVFFQNIVLVLLSHYIDATLFKVIIFVKEMYVVLVILVSFRRRRPVDSIEKICYISLIILIGLFITHSTGGLLGSLSSLRQLYLPFIFYIFGKSIHLSKRDMQRSIRFFIKMSVLAVLLGFVEMAIGDRFWDIIGIKNYMTLKGSARFIYSGELVPGSFYSYDFHPIIHRIRRMASILVDPVILGQLLGFAFTMAVFYKDLTSLRVNRMVYSFVLMVGLISTIAKGGFLIAGIATIVLIWKIWKKQRLFFLCVILAAMLVVPYVIFGMRNELSIYNHIGGLLGGIKTIRNNLFGVGIGGYGNLGSLLATGNVEGSESFVGSAIGQIGIFSFIYLAFYYMFLKNMKEMATFDTLSEILFWLNVGLLVTSFVNNTAISFTNCYIFYILPAVNLKFSNRRVVDILDYVGC